MKPKVARPLAKEPSEVTESVEDLSDISESLEEMESVRKTAIPHYGPARAERFVDEGIELKEMLPTMPFGRVMRQRDEGRLPAYTRGYDGHSVLNRAGAILNIVEKWPHIYNLIATEMAEENLTLEEFVTRVYHMPSPREIGTGTLSTLGDLIGRGMMSLPDY